MNNLQDSEMNQQPEIKIIDEPTSFSPEPGITIIENDEGSQQANFEQGESYQDSPPLKEARKQSKAQTQRQSKIIKEKDNQIQYMSSEIERMRYEVDSYRAATQQQAAIAGIHAETVLKNQKEKIKDQLKLAHEDNDPERIAHLTDELAEAHADIKAREMAQYYTPEPVYQPQQPYIPPKVQPEPEVDEEEVNDFEDWLMENPWCDPTSPQYDRRLGERAAEIGQEIKEQLRERGQEMDSRQFLDTVADVLEKKYPQRLNNRYKPHENYGDPSFNERFYETPRRQTMSPVAPVTRSNSNGYNNSGRKSNEIVLTRDQYETAMQIPPMMSGRELSRQEKVELYWKNLQNDPKQFENFPYNRR